MPTELNPIEARILGSLVEKQLTTPEYYPLTLNALVQACNQKNNRDPVVTYDEATVSHALDALRDRNLVYVFYASGSRVPKYKHMMREVYELDSAQLAVVTALLLRGAQTLGELRERAGRLHGFESLGEVEEVLRGLIDREPPLVVKLARSPGQKDARYMHLLSGAVETEAGDAENSPASARTSSGARGDRIAELEKQVATLAAGLDDLRARFEEFKNQFV